MKILISFGDNDFGTVLKAFGELFVTRAGCPWNPELLTKENIASWFEQVGPVLYEMVQARDYGLAQYEKGRTHLRAVKYFQLGPEEIFLGTEVDSKMEQYASWGNGAAVLITLGEKRYENYEPVTIL